MPLTPRSIKNLFDRLNTKLLQQGKPAVSYAQLATDLGLSKSTVFQILNATYKPRTHSAVNTRGERLKQLSTHLLAIAESHALTITPRRKVATEARPKQAATSPRPEVTRFCSTAGYFRFNLKDYFAGTSYAARMITVRTLPGKGHGVRIAQGDQTRDCYPIDPSTSQLGYLPANGGDR